MIASVRDDYNQAFSPEQYRAFLDAVHADLPGLLDFRVAETPVFVPAFFKEKLIAACDDIVAVLTREDYKELTDRAIPSHQFVPNEDEHPAFLAIDFAVCRDEQGELTPLLIELQGFPSLFGFQPYISEMYRTFFPIPENFSHLFNVDSNQTYLEHLRRRIVGLCDPEEVILLEIYPEKQKTRIDFELTKRYLGVEPVCLTKIRKNGRQLYYEKNGRQIHIKKIYNRLIFDELEQMPDLQTEFKLTDDVEVEWIGHPNWFFRVSKFTLPLLNSPYVPASYYLHTLPQYPEDLSQYVLKPLYSFAGSGVKLNITPSDLDAIPEAERPNYLLQRKVQYEPVVLAADGSLIKCEIRLLFIWHKREPRPLLLTNLSRLSRGEMIGVRFNKDFDWVGGSICYFEP
ncbi:hypothetical protein GCM10023189_10580 [Nibrella saemangeumensis]|uniref:Circularly permuted ATP-grasp type 2 n=1 Tax=Nibrella saemangeumensis TaxID=1084526 RepID=A0ABP8MGD4_9BACT